VFEGVERDRHCTLQLVALLVSVPGGLRSNVNIHMS